MANVVFGISPTTGMVVFTIILLLYTMIGGMIAATLFAVLFVPTFFVVFQRLSEALGKSGPDAKKEAMTTSYKE